MNCNAIRRLYKTVIVYVFASFIWFFEGFASMTLRSLAHITINSDTNYR